MWRDHIIGRRLRSAPFGELASRRQKTRPDKSRIYRGEITHKGNAYPGEHKAIVDKALWDKVQAVLAENRVDRTTGANAKYPSLLAGLVFDDRGND
jgi:Recombinase